MVYPLLSLIPTNYSFSARALFLVEKHSSEEDDTIVGKDNSKPEKEISYLLYFLNWSAKGIAVFELSVVSAVFIFLPFISTALS